MGINADDSPAYPAFAVQTGTKETFEVFLAYSWDSYNPLVS